MRLHDINAVAENGIIIAGSPASLIANVTMQVQSPSTSVPCNTLMTAMVISCIKIMLELVLCSKSQLQQLDMATLQDVSVQLKRLTQWPGRLQDRRPGDQGVIKSPAYLVFQEFASRLNYTNVKVRCGM